MAYELQTGETLPTGIKRIVHEQAQKALEHLHLAEDVEEDVHEMRKCMKRIRAVLRLVRYEIGEQNYQLENAAYRDAARELSAVRDSHVMIETFDHIVKASKKEAKITLKMPEIRKKLVNHCEQTIYEVIEKQDAFSKCIEQLEQAQARIDDWPVKHDDFSAIDDGLKRIYKQGVRGMARAYTNPTSAPHFHDWRKRVKYLWYHMQLLTPLCDAIASYAGELDTLADQLGIAHDYAVLYDKLANYSETRSGDGRRLLAQLDYQRAQNESAAQPLAADIYQKKPSQFIKRIASYWDAWQHQTVMS